MSEELNNFFSKSHQNCHLTNNANEVFDSVDKAVFKYKNHPSILTIKNSLGVAIPVLFIEVSLFDIGEELSSLNTKKNLLHLKTYKRTF